MTDRFVYLVEGGPYVGTIDNIANALRNAAYSGADVSLRAWTFANTGHGPLAVPPRHRHRLVRVRF